MGLLETKALALAERPLGYHPCDIGILTCAFESRRGTLLGGHDIKIAVVTSTNRHPVMEADFFLYNRVLIRFPWASDVKESCNY